ncbi:hypothetical protein [Feifania hominis]|uniref:Uncharacterized protein n=1 Tax=Feifania hominis TaxID=2763660 RepID=A0A926HUQ1_9FIRM|nr:hypothetical protein [Feifania hominis]MBC8536165.1 hypothetical protein [Feifania hominis]
MKKTVTVILVSAIILTLSYIAVSAEYGSADDPLISKSYLDSVLVPQLTEVISAKVAEGKETMKAEILKELGGATTGGGSAEYVAVQLFEGQTIRAATGSIEVLLRRGDFTCVDPTGEKITNVTKGGEAGDGGVLTLQNLYLIPRADGRGVRVASSEGWVMVRGGYIVE